MINGAFFLYKPCMLESIGPLWVAKFFEMMNGKVFAQKIERYCIFRVGFEPEPLVKP